ncbi:sensor histidine kinase [Asaia sp. W19]|nr:sensor histidine kinase [Asaia sp. W19]
MKSPSTSFWRFARLRPRLFDTVGSRVMALIVCTSLPLACVAGVLAWHTYLATADNSYDRTRSDALSARHEIINDIDRTRSALETLAGIGLHEEIAPRAFRLVQSISQQHYCALVLVDQSGRVVSTYQDLGTEVPGCDNNRLVLTPGEMMALPLHGEGSQAEIIFHGARPIVRAIVSLEYVDRSGALVSGKLVALRPLVNQQILRNDQYARPAADPESGSTDLWLYNRDVPPTPLTRRGTTPIPWSADAQARLDRDLKTRVMTDHFRLGMTYYTLIPGYGPVNIVAISARSIAENRALQLFLARLTLIVLILVVELLLVALAAQRYLVEPLEKLAFSVGDWRRNGTFQPDLPKSLPLEIRQMERAFSRATRRLDRHEARLQRATKQQDLLIREIHHRVKNNLQIVASLLNLQANRIKLPEAREEFHLVRDRIRSLATLHRYLYPEGGLSALDISAFLEELASQIFTANNRLNKGRVTLLLEVDPVPITPDQAVPIALVVTEVVTNALRYAFPDHRTGSVKVTLKREGEMAVLTIRDDGIGLSSTRAQDAAKREGIGLQLVKGFARQLGGTLEIRDDEGTEYRLSFGVQLIRRHLA